MTRAASTPLALDVLLAWRDKSTPPLEAVDDEQTPIFSLAFPRLAPEAQWALLLSSRFEQHEIARALGAAGAEAIEALAESAEDELEELRTVDDDVAQFVAEREADLQQRLVSEREEDDFASEWDELVRTSLDAMMR
jgi:hypothetical protein